MKLFCLVLVSFILPLPLMAESPYLVKINRGSVGLVRLSNSSLEDQVRANLEIGESSPLLGAIVDINNDQVFDYLICGPTSGSDSQCGTGGCPFIIVDGRRQTVIGYIFGSPILIDRNSTKGYFDINAYTSLNASAGNFITFKFNGEAYVEAHRKNYTNQTSGNLGDWPLTTAYTHPDVAQPDYPADATKERPRR